ncbi:MAG: beta-glucanase (GH16 family) [Cyclobacteriaceae bacterium]|jgi:beta-glucanase (GH16 family)
MKKISAFILLALTVASCLLISCGDEESTTPVLNIIPETGFESPLAYEGYNLIWQDEFEGETLNTDNWTHEIGRGNNGWGNAELQYYREENTNILDGHLVITARSQSFENAEYTSSRIITKGKQDFKYGRIDIRAALPTGQGIWPALWMLGANIDEVSWPKCGEIDIVELFGGTGAGNGDNIVKSSCHWYDGVNSNEPTGRVEFGSSYTLPEGDFDDEFHVFSITWDEQIIRAFVDDRSYFTIDISPESLSEFQEQFFMIFNIAVGGNRVGNPDATTRFPKRLVVDYVRVFQASE